MGWLLEHAASLLTLFGGVVAACGAFWAEVRANRDRHGPIDPMVLALEAEFLGVAATEPARTKKSFAPALTILLGALVATTGVYWSDVEQSNLQKQLNEKSNEIDNYSKQLVKKSNEIARLNEAISSTLSGGNSYSIILPLFSRPYRNVILDIQHKGEYPLYDVEVMITDSTKGKALETFLRHSRPPRIPLNDIEGVGSGNSGTRIPEILARSAAAGKTSSKFR